MYLRAMTEDWRTRLKKMIDETPGLTMKSLSLKAGLHASTLQSILKRGASPSVDNFVAIAKALGVSPIRLLEGDERFRLSVPVVGIVGAAGEGWQPVDEAHASDEVGFDLGSHDTVAFEVRGDSMAPVYRNGDFLICSRQYGPHADNLIGKDCLIKTAKNECFVKILKRGSRTGRFNLKSYNPVHDDIEDVTLQWVAPVVWIKRGVA